MTKKAPDVDATVGEAGPAAADALDWVTSHWDTGQLGDPAGMVAVASVLRLRELIMNNLEHAVEKVGLSGTDYLVLLTVMLGDRGQRPLGRIARAMMVHPTTVTQVVDRLERHKLVKRMPHPSDRRATLASITAKGRRVCARATELLRADGFGMPGVSSTQLAELTMAIQPVRQAAGDGPRPGVTEPTGS